MDGSLAATATPSRAPGGKRSADDTTRAKQEPSGERQAVPSGERHARSQAVAIRVEAGDDEPRVCDEAQDRDHEERSHEFPHGASLP